MEFKLKEKSLLKFAISAILASYTLETQSNPNTNIQAEQGFGTTVTGGNQTSATIDAGNQYAGGNAFYGLSAFQLGSGDSGTFGCTHCAANSVTNLLVRDSGLNDAAIAGTLVKAGETYIDGTLAYGSGISHTANFWLFNANGVVFGHNVTIDVPGAFYVSNANNIKDAAGNIVFGSVIPTNITVSTLSAADPISFGFSGTGGEVTAGTSYGVTLDGSSITAGVNVDANTKTISASGGSATIDIEGTTINIVSSTTTPATTTLTGSDITVAAQTNTDANGAIISGTGNLTIDSNGALTLAGQGSSTAATQVTAAKNLVLDGNGTTTGVITDQQTTGVANINAANNLELGVNINGNSTQGGIYHKDASATSPSNSTLNIGNAASGNSTLTITAKSTIKDTSTGGGGLNVTVQSGGLSLVGNDLITKTDKNGVLSVNVTGELALTGTDTINGAGSTDQITATTNIINAGTLTANTVTATQDLVNLNTINGTAVATNGNLYNGWDGTGKASTDYNTKANISGTAIANANLYNLASIGGNAQAGAVLYNGWDGAIKGALSTDYNAAASIGGNATSGYVPGMGLSTNANTNLYNVATIVGNAQANASKTAVTASNGNLYNGWDGSKSYSNAQIKGGATAGNSLSTTGSTLLNDGTIGTAGASNTVDVYGSDPTASYALINNGTIVANISAHNGSVLNSASSGGITGNVTASQNITNLNTITGTATANNGFLYNGWDGASTYQSKASITGTASAGKDLYNLASVGGAISTTGNVYNGWDGTGKASTDYNAKANISGTANANVNLYNLASIGGNAQAGSVLYNGWDGTTTSATTTDYNTAASIGGNATSGYVIGTGLSTNANTNLYNVATIVGNAQANASSTAAKASNGNLYNGWDGSKSYSNAQIKGGATAGNSLSTTGSTLLNDGTIGTAGASNTVDVYGSDPTASYALINNGTIVANISAHNGSVLNSASSGGITGNVTASQNITNLNTVTGTATANNGFLYNGWDGASTYQSTASITGNASAGKNLYNLASVGGAISTSGNIYNGWDGNTAKYGTAADYNAFAKIGSFANAGSGSLYNLAIIATYAKAATIYNGWDGNVSTETAADYNHSALITNAATAGGNLYNLASVGGSATSTTGDIYNGWDGNTAKYGIAADYNALANIASFANASSGVLYNLASIATYAKAATIYNGWDGNVSTETIADYNYAAQITNAATADGSLYNLASVGGSATSTTGDIYNGWDGNTAKYGIAADYNALANIASFANAGSGILYNLAAIGSYAQAATIYNGWDGNVSTETLADYNYSAQITNAATAGGNLYNLASVGGSATSTTGDIYNGWDGNTAKYGIAADYNALANIASFANAGSGVLYNLAGIGSYAQAATIYNGWDGNGSVVRVSDYNYLANIGSYAKANTNLYNLGNVNGNVTATSGNVDNGWDGVATNAAEYNSAATITGNVLAGSNINNYGQIILNAPGSEIVQAGTQDVVNVTDNIGNLVNNGTINAQNATANVLIKAYNNMIIDGGEIILSNDTKHTAEVDSYNNMTIQNKGSISDNGLGLLTIDPESTNSQLNLNSGNISSTGNLSITANDQINLNNGSTINSGGDMLILLGINNNTTNSSSINLTNSTISSSGSFNLDSGQNINLATQDPGLSNNLPVASSNTSTVTFNIAGSNINVVGSVNLGTPSQTGSGQSTSLLNSTKVALNVGSNNNITAEATFGGRTSNDVVLPTQGSQNNVLIGNLGYLEQAPLLGNVLFLPQGASKEGLGSYTVFEGFGYLTPLATPVVAAVLPVVNHPEEYPNLPTDPCSAGSGSNLEVKNSYGVLPVFAEILPFSVVPGQTVQNTSPMVSQIISNNLANNTYTKISCGKA